MELLISSDKMSDMANAVNPKHVAAGKRLDELRIALDFRTKVAFAAWLDVKESRYRRWVKGQNGIPSDVIQILKDRKGVTSDWLKHGDPSGLPAWLYQLLYKAA